jgi:arylsulfatase A-like enzyme
VSLIFNPVLRDIMANTAAQRMNVLFIIDDQHRADCLGYMGHPCVKTPNLDKLAGESVVFTNAFTPSPVCMAARGAILTGRYPSSIRVRGMGILPPQETTTAELFQRAGYHTGAMGKLHLTPQLYSKAQLGIDSPCLDWRRFAHDAALCPAVDDPCKSSYGFIEHVGCDDTLQGNHRRWVASQNPELADVRPTYPMPEVSRETFVSPYSTELHQTGFVAHLTQDYIRRRAAQPWYAWCGFVGPHHPFEAPADQLARYDGLDMPETVTHSLTNDEGLIPAPASSAIGEFSRYPKAYRDLITRHYLAAISTIDDRVGAILQTLRETGQYDNTIIVFTADHGEMLFDHGLLRKPSIHYDATLRVPMLIRVPGVAPRRVDSLVELTDLHPTLLGLAGLRINPGSQGIDWSNAIHQNQAIGRPEIYSEMCDLSPMVFGEPHGPYMAVRTLRSEQWKLNLYPSAGSQYGQLFDLKNDPAETRNLYAQPDYAAVRFEMTWQLIQRLSRDADPLPLALTQW